MFDEFTAFIKRRISAGCVLQRKHNAELKIQQPGLHSGSPRPSASTLLSFVVCKLTANNREYDIEAQRRFATPRLHCALSLENFSHHALTQCKFIL